MVILYWGLWQARNEKTWQGKVWCEAGSWKEQRHSGKDGSWLQQCTHSYLVMEGTGNAPAMGTGCRGFGWVVRDSSREFVKGAAKCWTAECSPRESEIIGIREALTWLCNQGWDRVDVESDAL
ncbi:unnamed protein product [Cuscuta epithymum]|uniref:RNase H type-1 domain-containing protein n=1 Tax=Cuscuta epithymum TaxID=186058 RepID=A0AAV0C2A9_9ASTE|nr:unnamed protein product [Cuscuta epithymum]